MRKQSAEREEKKAKFSRISRVTLDEINSLDILEFAQRMGDTFQKSGRNYFTYRNGNEDTPSLCISPYKNIWSDFGGSDAGNSALTYYAYRIFNSTDLGGRLFEQAVLAVASLSGIDVVYENGKVVKPAEIAVVPVWDGSRMIDEIPKATAERIHDVYTKWSSLLELSDDHMKHFIHERKFSAGEVRARRYRTLVPEKKKRLAQTKQLVREVGQLDGIPGFSLCKGTHEEFWTVLQGAGFLIPYRSITNQIKGWQIRFDNPPPLVSFEGNLKVRANAYKVQVISSSTGEILWEGSKKQLPIELPDGRVFLKPGAKYKWLASDVFKERGILKGTLLGTPSPYHAAVPSSILKKWAPGTPLNQLMDTRSICWGEGALKGDRASEVTGKLHLQAAGVSSWRVLLEPTLELKPEEVIFTFDADSQNDSKNVGKSVLSCIEEVRPIFREQNIRLKIWLWPEDLGKGIDDLFNRGYRGQEFEL
ncbi:DUF3854 domain-containing protein [Paenibacillus thiaminolyticus]|uniref:DUF3854 domain-containing protein n=1 Tax=Paenibacillus thiaminolyticus TaxID=49283 RepID=A0A3A3GCG1_PANTH|nr:DUF3854 domain-containing protein [Paenibacillus thiaminolyticus]RJG21364.1 DUF3854 domain-containing protein [Paenibacillus thiaminolyticus]